MQIIIIFFRQVLWAKFYTKVPALQRQSVEQYKASVRSLAKRHGVSWEASNARLSKLCRL